MAVQDRRENLWAIVFAAGEGTRLSTLTRFLHGWNMPKQFAAHPCGWTDLLDAKLDRIAAIVPRQRTVVVVADDCRALAETQLRDYSEVKEVEMLRVN